MKTFEQIESEFLDIDANDNSAIIRYFYENEESLLSIHIDNKENGIRYLWILAEVLNAAFERNEQEIIKSLSNSTIRKYRSFPTRYHFDIKNDSNYKLLLINVAQDQLHHRKYFSACRILRELHQIEHSNNKIKELYFDSLKRTTLTLSRMSGILGITLILLKYVLKILEIGSRIELLIMGYTGACFLIVFGIVEIALYKKRKKRTVANDTAT